MQKNSQGVYETVNGIIMYNKVIPEEVEVPKTSLSSAALYVSGLSLFTVGGWVLIKNGKES